MKKIITTVLATSFLINSSVLANTLLENDDVIVKYKDPKPYYQDQERGWFFYEKPEVIEKNKDEEKEVVQVQKVEPPPPVEPELSPRERLKKQGEEYEDAVALAVLEPSPENYKDYLTKSQILLNQAHSFADGIEKYIYTAPNFDTRLNQGADITLHNQMNVQQKRSQLSALAQDNAILFFYRSDCPYCHKYAPIIKRFSQDYGFMIVPMALDDKPLMPEFPQFRTDNNLARKLEVSAVPALYLLNPKQNNVSTIGFGLSDYETLGDKVISASTRDYAQTQLSQ